MNEDTLIERYTRIQPCCVEDWPDACHVFFDSGVQHFRISATALDNKDEGEWLRRQFARALLNVIGEVGKSAA